jgi:hypothetical protein
VSEDLCPYDSLTKAFEDKLGESVHCCLRHLSLLEVTMLVEVIALLKKSVQAPSQDEAWGVESFLLRTGFVLVVSERVMKHRGVANREEFDALGLRPGSVPKYGYLNLGDAPPSRGGTGVRREGGFCLFSEVTRDVVHFVELIAAYGPKLFSVGPCSVVCLDFLGGHEEPVVLLFWV